MREDLKLVYKKRNKGIVVILFAIWLITVFAGMIGFWKNITTPLLGIVSSVLTVIGIITIVRKKNCNRYLGICSMYLSLLFLYAGYKVLFWKLKLPAYYFLVGIILLGIFSLLVLKRFVKKGKEIKAQKIAPAVALASIYPIMHFVMRRLDENLSDEIMILILAVLLIILAFMMAQGVRYFAIDDEKVLFDVETF